jgi:squalene-hopene/tetraprenyl-beta-curcumene cyclase
MLERCEDSDGLGAIFPPIIWSVVALKCLGYADDSPEQRANLAELEKLKVRDGDRLWLQPCLSPVWDTVITLRALAAAGYGGHDEPIARGIDWLLSNEIRTPGDWSRSVRCEPGGWAFEYRNRFYPDIDDTIMALMALRETNAEGCQAAVDRALTWTLAMQNGDGGWGAFDRDNDAEFLCRVPFADHNAMIDPSTPDISARVLEALAAWGVTRGHAAVDRAIDYIRRSQESDGAWFGRWGVNYIYGTWQALVGLVAAGVPQDDPMIIRGAQWLLDHQQPGGGWGESADTYAQPDLRGQGNPTPSQTAWALLGLAAAGHAKSMAVRSGVQYLLDTQSPDGTWEETEFTGTGFPRVFYLRYHYYRVYFPLLALANFRSRQDKAM